MLLEDFNNNNFDYDRYMSERTKGLNLESQFFIKQAFNAVNNAVDEGNLERVKLLFLDLLILSKQKEQMFKQIGKMTMFEKE